MDIEYILYGLLVVTFIAFIGVSYIFFQSIIRRIVISKIKNYSIFLDKKITHRDLDQMYKYIEKNKKYLLLSQYKEATMNIKKIELKMVNASLR